MTNLLNEMNMLNRKQMTTYSKPAPDYQQAG